MTTPDGRPIATPGWPRGRELPAALQAAIRGAAAGESRRDIVAIDGKLFLVTSEPAKFAEAEVLGTVTFGFPLDDRVAQQLSQITRADINLVSGNRLAGSSLSPDEQKDVAALLAAGSLGSATGISAGVRPIGRREFIEGTFPLFRDRADRRRSSGAAAGLGADAGVSRRAAHSLLFAGVGGFVLALGGGLFFSHRTSQPLMDMAAAARDIAAGDWSRTVPARGSAEATTMANGVQRHDPQPARPIGAAEGVVSAVLHGHAIGARRDHLDRHARRHHVLEPQRRGHVRVHRSGSVGQPLTMLIAESDRPRTRRHCPIRRRTTSTLGHIIEVTGVRKDGGRFPSEFSLAALHGPEGTAFTAVVRDVMERKQSQDTLRQREEQLRQAQKMEAIGRLAGGVAHDFNNLLMAIHGYGEMLVQNLAEGDERRTDAEEIVKAADRAAGLTRQLLAFSSRQVITQQAVALDQLVQNMQNMLQRLIGPEIQIVDRGLARSHARACRYHAGRADSRESRDQRARCDAAGRKDRHRAEKHRARQDRRGGAPRLQPGDYVEMSVSDTGSGMDAETLSRIFEPFFTTKESGKGTGLGWPRCMASCSRTTARLKCRAALDTARPSTSICRAPRISANRRRCRRRSGGGNETILLVEDDDRVRALVSNMLRKHGFTVLLASAGDQALEIAARHRGPVHLLLTDVLMPG